MIIKSMARKQPSFGQLIAYMGRDADGQADTLLTRNLYGHMNSPKAIEAEFLQNHAHLPTRKNGNALFHEVLVLEQNPNISRARQTQILKSLANEYLSRRAPDQLAFGRVHHNTDHAHIHLMISANSIRSSSRKRLTKSRFAEIQREIEALALNRFPELGDRPVYTRERDQNLAKMTTRETEQDLRSQKSNRKEQIKRTFEHVLLMARSRSDLEQFLAAADLKLYRRGNQIGLEPVSGGRRHRLKTLGSLSIFESWQSGLSKQTVAQKPTVELSKQNKPSDDRAAKLLKSRQQAEQFAERHLDDDWSR